MVTSTATLRSRRPAATRFAREKRYGRADRMSSTGAAGAGPRSSDRTAGFVLTGASVLWSLREPGTAQRALCGAQPQRARCRLRLRGPRAGGAVQALRRRARAPCARPRLSGRRPDPDVPRRERDRRRRRRSRGARRGVPARHRDALGRPRPAARGRGRTLTRSCRGRAPRAPPRPPCARGGDPARAAPRRNVRGLRSQRLPPQTPTAVSLRTSARERSDAPADVLPRRRTRGARRLRGPPAALRRRQAGATSREAVRERHRVRGTQAALKLAQIGRGPLQSEEREPDTEGRRSPTVEQVRVVKVRMHDLAAERAPDAAREHPDRVRRRKLEQPQPVAKLQPRRLLQLQMCCAVLEVRRTERGRGAVGVAELRDGARNVAVEVPATTTEQPDAEADGAQPLSLLAHDRSGISGRRPRVVGRGPVRVEAERPELLRLARALEPALAVLAPGGRTHQSRDREPSGAPPLQLREPAPYLLIQRTLHMTRDDGVPSVQY